MKRNAHWIVPLVSIAYVTVNAVMLVVMVLR